MVIETERLLLREMTHDDFRALYQALADSDIIYEPISKKKDSPKKQRLRFLMVANKLMSLAMR